MNNPIIKAARAAYGELTTPEAVQWYKATAHQTYLVIATIITLAVCLVEDWLLDPQELPADAPSDEFDLIDLALPASPIAGLLMPAKEVVKAARVLVTPAAAPERVLITPPNVIYNMVKSILPTVEYSGGIAARSSQAHLLYRR